MLTSFLLKLSKLLCKDIMYICILSFLSFITININVEKLPQISCFHVLFIWMVQLDCNVHLMHNNVNDTINVLRWYHRHRHRHYFRRSEEGSLMVPYQNSNCTRKLVDSMPYLTHAILNVHPIHWNLSHVEHTVRNWLSCHHYIHKMVQIPLHVL